MPSFGGITYTELNNGSGILGVGENAMGRRRLRCDWSRRLLLALALRGWTPGSLFLNSVAIASVWNIAQPAAHPCGLGYYCTDVAIMPMGRPQGEDSWDFAVLDVTYKPLTFSTPTATDLIDESGELSGEMVDLGVDGWQFGTTPSSGNALVTRSISKVLPTINHQITQYHLATLPLANMRALLGKLNNAPWRGAPIGTVMYAGGSYNRKIVAILGKVSYYDWVVNHKFCIGSRDLRTEWNPNTGAFSSVVNSNGTFKFDLGDFSSLGIPIIF